MEIFEIEIFFNKQKNLKLEFLVNSIIIQSVCVGTCLSCYCIRSITINIGKAAAKKEIARRGSGRAVLNGQNYVKLKIVETTVGTDDVVVSHTRGYASNIIYHNKVHNVTGRSARASN